LIDKDVDLSTRPERAERRQSGSLLPEKDREQANVKAICDLHRDLDAVLKACLTEDWHGRIEAEIQINSGGILRFEVGPIRLRKT